VIDNDSKVRVQFRSHSMNYMAISLAVPTQYTNVTDRYHTTAWRGKNLLRVAPQ